MIFEVIKHAKKMLFDNSKSGMSAENTQDAIDELKEKHDSDIDTLRTAHELDVATLIKKFASYLPLTGGTLTGELFIKKSGQAQVILESTDTNGKKGTLVAKQNAFGLYDSTHKKWLITCGAEGNVKMNGLADMAYADANGNRIDTTYTQRQAKNWSTSATIETTKMSGGLALFFSKDICYILSSTGNRIATRAILSHSGYITVDILGDGSGTIGIGFERTDGYNDIFGLLPIIGDWTLS